MAPPKWWVSDEGVCFLAATSSETLCIPVRMGLDYDQVASAGAMNSVNRNMRVQGHQSRIMSNRQGQEINVSQLPVASQPPRVQSCVVQQADIFANEAMVFG